MRRYAEIIVRGGLGNQLFCMLHAYKLLLQGELPRLNLWEYTLRHTTGRPFLASSLLSNTKHPIESTRKLTDLIHFLLARSIDKAQIKLLPATLHKVPGDNQIVLALPCGPSIHIGYYQHINNSALDKCALAMLRNDIRDSISLNRRANHLAVHLRRGDYLLANHSQHGVIALKPVLDQISRLLLTDRYSTVVIFTDSPSLFSEKDFSSLNASIIYDTSSNGIEAISSMMCCEGIIASNSTLSLWAGLLSDCTDFLIPSAWTKECSSSVLGLEWVKRYPAYFESTA